jgi:hypothetical protein
MAHAFISRNPLLPRDYFTPGLDPEVAKWNAGQFSLLKCPGKFSIRVATFKGRSTFLGAQNGVEEEGSRLRPAKENDPLVLAGENAEKLTLALREKGWEAYSFHDRNESYVTVGSFNEMQELGDGRYAPATREAQIITQVFGAATPNVGFEKPAYQELGLDSNDIAKAERNQAEILAQFTAEMSKGLGQAAAGFHPKQFVGLPFDIQPQPILAPKESIGAVYAQ